ncbi:MAG: hypothetical protein KGJ59_10875 [Bacteroidota bacterium]|nr:hypothetical protein [Bacteroidota bacterium]
MKTTKLVISLAACFLLQVMLVTDILSQDSLRIFKYPSAKEIAVSVVAHVTELKNGKFFYEYQLQSLPNSKQNIWTFDVEYHAPVQEIQAPTEWLGDPGYLPPPRVQWYARDSLVEISPDSKLGGFSFLSGGIPSIEIYYVSGWVEPPVFTEENAPDSVIGDNVLENSVKGITIGPTAPPVNFSASTWIDTLISYKHQAVSLGWIDNQGIANSLDSKLDNAKSKLSAGDTTAAKNMLNAFVNEVEAQNGKQLTSEAYALLKFNAEYLIDRLPEKKGEKK